MDNQDITPRVGTFFIIIGLGSIILFIISDIANTAEFDYLFLGLLSIGVGFFFRRNTEKTASSGRFEWWKSMRDKDKKEKKDD